MRRHQGKQRFHPRVDALENRLAPAIFTVNSAADTDDGVADATNTTLREAILAANATAEFDEIHFDIPGNGVKTIRVGSTGLGDLPSIDNPLKIDGYTQTGAQRNTHSTEATDAELRIELNGEDVTASAGGLRITAAGVHVTGLVINRFTGGDFVNAITVPEFSGAIIEGNFIGTNAAGTVAQPNSGIGIEVTRGSLSAVPNLIGDGTPAGVNFIAGNLAEGIVLTSGTLVRGNIIGGRAFNGDDIANGGTGIFVFGSANVIENNKITHNGTRTDFTYHHGIVLTQWHFWNGEPYDPAVGQNTVKYNFIGGNVEDGIYVALSNNNILSDNQIFVNGRNGVSIAGDERTAGNRIVGSDYRHSFFNNGNLRIDLGADGPTVNDPDDGDAGPGGLLNHPEITRVEYRPDPLPAGSGQVTIEYRVPTTSANASYPLLVQFFTIITNEDILLAEDNYELADEGRLKTVTISVGVIQFNPQRGAFATATDADGNTSEVSPAVKPPDRSIVINPTNGLMTTELGGTASFTVVLTKRPTAPVLLMLSSSNLAEGTLSVTQLEFTPGNFDNATAHRVTITGVEDAAADGNVAYEIVFAPAVSEDTSYAGLSTPNVPVLNLDDELAEVQVFLNAPGNATVGQRFDYEVTMINLGAEGQFTVTIDAPADFVSFEREGRRARFHARRPRSSQDQVFLPTGEFKTIRFRARVLPGSGGALLHATVTVTAPGASSASASADTEVAVQDLSITLHAPDVVYRPTLDLGELRVFARFRYTITIRNPNAIAAAGVVANVTFGQVVDYSDSPEFTVGRIKRGGTSSFIDPNVRPFLLGALPPGETIIVLTAVVGSDNDDKYSARATLTGTIGGTSFDLATSTVRTTVKRGGVELVFLAGLAALAGQEYLDQRRRRRKKQADDDGDLDAVDEAFTEPINDRA